MHSIEKNLNSKVEKKINELKGVDKPVKISVGENYILFLKGSTEQEEYSKQNISMSSFPVDNVEYILYKK